MKNIIKYVSIGLFALTVIILSQKSQPASASVSQGSEYIATTTTQTSTTNIYLTPTNSNGTFGSVIITGANTGILTVYDGTSTANANIRVLASFPASAAAGTYTFDARYSIGLVVGITGTAATSTITYR